MPGISIYAVAAVQSLQVLINNLSATIGQYIYIFYLQSYPNSTNSTSNYTRSRIYYQDLFLNLAYNEKNSCLTSNSSIENDAELWAQQHSANLSFWMNLASSLPVIIMTYILGLYITRLGKRIVLLLPMLGITIQTIIWLCLIYFHLPEFWWYISAFIVGLSGSGGVFGLILNLIITENTEESTRSSRFVCLGAMQTAVSAIASVAIGYYISWRGFADLYWFTLFLQIISMFIVIYNVKSDENNHSDEQTPLLIPNDDKSKELQSNTCSQCFQICVIFRSKRRSKKKTITLFLILFSNIFYTLAITALAPFLLFLLNIPFCWGSKDIGNYSALGAISSAILSLFGMQFLNYFGASDSTICMISHALFCVSYLLIGCSQYSWQLYAILLISAFSNYQGLLTTSMMSKCLESYEHSHAFTFLTEINTIICVFGNSFFNWIYSRTVVNHRNLTMFIAASISLIPLILNGCLTAINRMISDEQMDLNSPNDNDTSVIVQTYSSNHQRSETHLTDDHGTEII